MQEELKKLGDGGDREIVAALLELPIVLWEIDIEGIIRMSVGTGLASLGLKPGELVGMNVFDLYGWSPEALEPIRRCLTGVETRTLNHVDDVVWENRYFPRKKDGITFGLYGLSMDVTRQFEAERDGKKADLTWRTMAENAPGTISILNPDHTFSYVNSPDHAYLVEKKAKVYELIEESHRDVARRAIETCFSEAIRCEYEGTTQIGGDIYWFENRLAPIVEDGVVTSVIIVSTDVTTRKETEAAARALEAQSLQAQKLESLGMLAGGIAHDFNNLLVGMMGYTELARLQIAAGLDATPSLNGVEAAATRAAELCEQMLAYAGKGHFEMRKIDLSRLVEDFSQLLSVSLRKGLILKRELAKDLWRIEADGAQIQQVVMNLITNAADAMSDDDGSVTIRTGCGHFDDEALSRFPLIQPIPPGDYVFLEVSDLGYGMNKQTMQKMFDPFFTTKTTGRGLGLASTLAIIRGHGGGLSTRSELGSGTTMRLFLPRSGEAGRPSLTNTPSSDVSSLGNQQTILLADDEPNVLKVAAAMLKHLGFIVIPVRNGQEALDMYPLHPEIAVVILDVTMPVMAGDIAAAHLLELDPMAKIILTSGYHDQGTNHPAMKTLPKPYRMADLRAVLIELLSPVNAAD